MHSATDWPGVDTESKVTDVPRDRIQGVEEAGGSIRQSPAVLPLPLFLLPPPKNSLWVVPLIMWQLGRLIVCKRQD